MNPFLSSEDAEDDDRRRRWLIEGKCTKPFLFAPSLWLRHILDVFTHTLESQSRHKAASSWSNQSVKTCWIDCLGFFCRSVVGGLVSMGIHSRRMDNVIFGCSQYSRHPPHRIHPNIHWVWLSDITIRHPPLWAWRRANTMSWLAATASAATARYSRNHHHHWLTGSLRTTETQSTRPQGGSGGVATTRWWRRKQEISDFGAEKDLLIVLT